MFKNLKVLKLLAFVALTIGIFATLDFSKYNGIQIFTLQPSYSLHEDIIVGIGSTNKINFERDIEVKDINGSVVVDEQVNLELIKEDKEELITKGFLHSTSCTLSLEHEKPGLYTIDDSIPLIIRNNKKSLVTVVYPFANNMLYSRFEGHTALNNGGKYVSMNRSVGIDMASNNLIGLIDANYESLNYIADLDLNKNGLWQESNVLVVYGKSKFYTLEMVNNLYEYCERGGNILFISTYFPELEINVAQNNRIEKLLLNDNKDWKTLPGFFVSSWKYGGYTFEEKYTIIQEEHPVFNGVTALKIRGELFSGVPIKWVDKEPVNRESKLYQVAILGYLRTSYEDNDKLITGIIELTHKESEGRIISLGTEAWLTDENFQKNSTKSLIMNSIDYLLSLD